MHTLPPLPRPRIRELGGARPAHARAGTCVAGMPNPVQGEKRKKNQKKDYTPLCVMLFITDAARCTLQSLFFFPQFMFTFLPDATMPSMMVIEPTKSDSSSTVSPITMYLHHYHLNCGARPGDIEPSIKDDMRTWHWIRLMRGGEASGLLHMSLPLPSDLVVFSILSTLIPIQSRILNLGTLMIGAQEDPIKQIHYRPLPEQIRRLASTS